MRRLSYYVLKQLIGPVALFTFLLTCVIWLTQALQLLDLIINRGQSATTFAYLTVLILPTLLVIILPLAFFAGTLYALSRLNSDSELVVMASAGFSRAQLAVPTLVAAAIVMGLTYLCGLYLMPAGQRALNEKKFDISSNISAALLTEGTFNTQAKGLTVFIRAINDDGMIQGVLVHDSRNPKAPITYFARSGRIVQTPAGARLVMNDGTIEQSSHNGARLNVLKFQRYVFDLAQFASQVQASQRRTNEMYLGELLHPGPGLKEKTRNAYIAEAHNRLSQPLYCIAFALIALAAVTRGRSGRGAHMLRMTMASMAATGLWIADYGMHGLVANNPSLVVLYYALPSLGAGVSIWTMAGRLPRPNRPITPAEASA